MNPAHYSDSHLAMASLVLGGLLLAAMAWLLWDLNRTNRIG